VAIYLLTGGAGDGDSRIAEDRGPTDEAVVYRDDSWKYGRGYYSAARPIRYVDTIRGRALVLVYIGEQAPQARTDL
jgi:hypothetical protein